MDGAILRARTVGRLLRAALAAALIYVAAIQAVAADATTLLTSGAWFAALTAVYSVLHLLIARFARRLNPWIGALLAVIPVICVAILGGGAGTMAAFAYIGISLAIVAARSDGGCEVMAIPSLIFGRYTHLVCIVFTPIDWVEARIAGEREASNAG